MNIPQLTALCLRYQGVLLDASEEVVHVAVVDAPSHELLDALHFATTKRIEITCWTGNSLSNWQETPSHFVLRPYHVGVVKRWY